MKPIERHRLINKLLAIEMTNGIHALSIQAKTINQWLADPLVKDTPNCKGGSKK